ncbi:LETM1 and EF-hand domain-containing protein anon-60Da [Arachis hypogaea]|nr:LETM1 and EF-hand domain-containing protein anon-60Da [Arachis hypogaea]
MPFLLLQASPPSSRFSPDLRAYPPSSSFCSASFSLSINKNHDEQSPPNAEVMDQESSEFRRFETLRNELIELEKCAKIAEKSDLKEKLKGLQHEVHAAELDWEREHGPKSRKCVEGEA